MKQCSRGYSCVAEHVSLAVPLLSHILCGGGGGAGAAAKSSFKSGGLAHFCVHWQLRMQHAKQTDVQYLRVHIQFCFC